MKEIKLEDLSNGLPVNFNERLCFVVQWRVSKDLTVRVEIEENGNPFWINLNQIERWK